MVIGFFWNSYKPFRIFRVFLSHRNWSKHYGAFSGFSTVNRWLFFLFLLLFLSFFFLNIMTVLFIWSWRWDVSVTRRSVTDGSTVKVKAERWPCHAILLGKHRRNNNTIKKKELKKKREKNKEKPREQEDHKTRNRKRHGEKYGENSEESKTENNRCQSMSV